MPAVTIIQPFEMFFDTDGTPLENGQVYIGAPGVDAETNPVTVYWDSALSTTATQPIRTTNGYPVNNGAVSNFFVNADNFSVTIRDSDSNLVFSQQNYDFSLPFTTFSLAKSETGAVSRELSAILNDLISIKDFGAVGDGVTDDTAAFTAAEAIADDYVYIPDGTYIVTGITLNKEYFGPGTIELDSVVQDVWFDELVRTVQVTDTFFTDSGAADAYVLTKVNGRPIESYEDGMEARFIADNASTGGAVTVNLDGVSASTIVLPGGGNPAAGDISTSLVNTIRYDLGNTRWELQKADSVLESNIFPAFSNGNPGYIQFKNGLIIQWGISSTLANQTTQDITLPVTFSSTFFAAYSTPYITTTSGGNESSSVFRATNSSVRVLNTGNGASFPIQWLAIGV